MQRTELPTITPAQALVGDLARQAGTARGSELRITAIAVDSRSGNAVLSCTSRALGHDQALTRRFRWDAELVLVERDLPAWTDDDQAAFEDRWAEVGQLRRSVLV